MARNVEPRYADIFIDDEMETVTNAKVRIQTNIPMKWIEKVDTNDPTTVCDFLFATIHGWEGFDMDLTRENISVLTVADIRGLSGLIMSAIQNPLKATSAASQ